MYEVRVFDGGNKPLITSTVRTEETAKILAQDTVKGEDKTWRAEVWGPDGRRVHTAYPQGYAINI